MSVLHLDFHILPDADLPAAHIVSALYARLHRELVSLGTRHVAVSFPGMQVDVDRPTLGTCLRLLGPAAELDHLAQPRWLAGVQDHVSWQAPSAVPAGASHRSLRRVQAKSNPERLRRRLMKRHGLDATQAQSRIPDGCAQMLTLPYINMSSASTGQRFRLFLQLGPIEPQAAAGTFNFFGLSADATIPWF